MGIRKTTLMTITALMGASIYLSNLAFAFPDSGKTISLVVPYPPGGGSDASARALAPFLEAELGIPVMIVNKGGAGSQVGMAFVANSRPDGYTLGYGLWPALITIYSDQARNPTFDRTSFAAVALHMIDPGVIAVADSSPFRTLDDLIEAAKDTDNKLRVSDNGLLNSEHLMWLTLQQQTGTDFANAHFSGGGQAVSSLLGGHIDAAAGGLSPWVGHIESGSVRILAVLGEERSKFFPDASTAVEQGYDLTTSSARGFVVPAGTDREVIAALANALSKAIAMPEHQQFLAKLRQESRFMGPEEFEKFWDETEKRILPIWKSAVEAIGR